MINGVGEIHHPNGSAYKGAFVDGVKEGHGVYYIDPSVGGTYSLEGTFTAGQPNLEANDIRVEVVSPVAAEEETAKAKAPAKGKEQVKAPTFTEEEEANYENRVLYQIGGDFTEEPQVLHFKLKCVF